jgi:polyphenol oxidase
VRQAGGVFRWSERLDGGGRSVFAGCTARPGGSSAAPFAELNLGDHVGDDIAAVAANRALLAQAAGVAPDHLLFLRQVHGREVAVAEGPWAGPAPAADAAVTRTEGLALAVLVADCVPVLLADPAAGVVGVAHAGRQGLVAGVVGAAVAAMRDLGARTVTARVGPSVCGRCYEVPEQMAQDVAARVPAARSTTSWGTPALDVAAGVLSQLAACCDDVRWWPACTREDEGLYSFRRSATTGRFAGVVRLGLPDGGAGGVAAATPGHPAPAGGGSPAAGPA